MGKMADAQSICVCERLQQRMPIICTPEELMGA
jgi:hypothetical protein